MAEEQTSVDQATNQTNLEVEETKVFTQEDVNRIGTKEHNSGYSKAIRDLGFEDAEAAKNALKAYQDWQESQKSEAEKQSEALKSKEEALSNADNRIKSLEAENAALKQGVNADSVEDVVALAERLVNDETTIDQAIQKVLDKYPHFSGGQEEVKPTFSAKGNPSVDMGVKVKDPFQDVIDNYK
ncbi:hypothetical protein [Tuanshanicoccus lijuaniae]|uniref:hypothetical protein n=1 Tax=Aerococcaceae bacterium zg-1292 TaxID=2774330 RepID=UPI001BD8AEA3|nr:hypothetical protein [Aerococcaceae bacterium zg-A91]MBS4457968.1 hypothetical protein [Aerococcaceae bacterium zg-BR33]